MYEIIIHSPCKMKTLACIYAFLFTCHAFYTENEGYYNTDDGVFYSFAHPTDVYYDDRRNGYENSNYNMPTITEYLYPLEKDFQYFNEYGYDNQLRTTNTLMEDIIQDDDFSDHNESMKYELVSYLYDRNMSKEFPARDHEMVSDYEDQWIKKEFLDSKGKQCTLTTLQPPPVIMKDSRAINNNVYMLSMDKTVTKILSEHCSITLPKLSSITIKERLPQTIHIPKIEFEPLSMPCVSKTLQNHTIKEAFRSTIPTCKIETHTLQKFITQMNYFHEKEIYPIFHTQIVHSCSTEMVTKTQISHHTLYKSHVFTGAQKKTVSLTRTNMEVSYIPIYDDRTALATGSQSIEASTVNWEKLQIFPQITSPILNHAIGSMLAHEKDTTHTVDSRTYNKEFRKYPSSFIPYKKFITTTTPSTADTNTYNNARTTLNLKHSISPMFVSDASISMSFIPSQSALTIGPTFHLSGMPMLVIHHEHHHHHFYPISKATIPSTIKYPVSYPSFPTKNEFIPITSPGTHEVLMLKNSVETFPKLPFQTTELCSRDCEKSQAVLSSLPSITSIFMDSIIASARPISNVELPKVNLPETKTSSQKQFHLIPFFVPNVVPIIVPNKAIPSSTLVVQKATSIVYYQTVLLNNLSAKTEPAVPRENLAWKNGYYFFRRNL